MYMHARTLEASRGACVYFRVYLSFSLWPLPLPLASICPSAFIASRSVSFIALHRFLSFFFLRDLLTLPLSAALTRCDPLRIIARPNRPNCQHPSIGYSLSDALHLPADVESQNKRTTNVAARRRCSIHTYRQFRRSETPGDCRLYFSPLLQPVFPSLRDECLSFFSRASFFRYLPFYPRIRTPVCSAICEFVYSRKRCL